MIEEFEFSFKYSREWQMSNGRKKEDHRVAFKLGDKEISSITLCRDITPIQNLQVLDDPLLDFWFDLSRGPITPRSVVIHHGTVDEYRGRGIQGVLLEKANEISKQRFGSPLASDYIFGKNPGSKRGYHPSPAMHVWEKLEREGKARLSPIAGMNRWIMY